MLPFSASDSLGSLVLSLVASLPAFSLWDVGCLPCPRPGSGREEGLGDIEGPYGC